MAFDLSGFFGTYNSANASTVNVRANGDINISNLNNNSAVSARLLALLPGQTVQGEVVNVQGNQVQLLLSNELLLNASLESKADINVGQLMSFQVKGNSGSLISLLPLSVNLTTDESVMKALNEASLPVTDKTVDMVKNLMNEGMPIDKDTLININKELMTYPDADVETIVQMERLKIPVTSENIEQFEAYKNYNHKLSQGISQFQEQLNELISAEQTAEGVVAENKTEFFQKLLAFFAGDTKEAAATEETVILKSAQQGDKSSVEASVTVPGKDNNSMIQEEGALNQTVKAEADLKAGTESLATGKEVLNATEKQTFLSLLKEMGASQNIVDLFETGQVSAKQLTAALQMENLNGKQLEQLFSSKEFGKFMQNELTEQMLLNPEQITKEKVEAYFDHIKNQTEKLMQILESTGRADTPAAKTLQNLNQNVDFLNQLNQMFTYVQLPLKMAGDAAHGDLYVYTNKKNLAKKDGNVSALLHLDMPHLGMVDVYVAMQAERVSTNFYLQDEDMMDFLEGHMSLLTDRLEKKGYQASAKVILKEKENEGETSVIQEMLKQDKNVPEIGKIAVRSFDVRA